MKKLLVLTLIFCFNHSFSQVKGGKNSKLFDLYAMEKYEDCAYKAENLTMNDKTKKDPESYLYLSMCYLKISGIDKDKLDQEYKDPLKESLKYAKKFRSKDKDGSLYEANKLFFDELKTAAIQYANSLYNQNQYGKAASFFGLINGFDEKDDNVKFMEGVCDMLAKNATEGSKGINDAMKNLYNAYNDSTFKPDAVSTPLLVQAMIIYSDYLKNNKMEDSAKASISVARNFFPENQEIKNQYNVLHGLPLDEKEPVKEQQTETRYELHQPKNDIQIPADSVKNSEEQNPENAVEEKEDESKGEKQNSEEEKEGSDN